MSEQYFNKSPKQTTLLSSHGNLIVDPDLTTENRPPTTENKKKNRSEILSQADFEAALARLLEITNSEDSCSSSSSCNCPDCRIVYSSGIEITDENCQLTIGQTVSLSLSCDDVDDIEDFEWSLPEGSFSDCTPEGELIPVPASELTSSSVTYRLGSVGDQSVSVSYVADGASCSTSTTLCVEKPECEILLNGMEVSEDNATVWIGDQICLNISCGSLGIPLKNIQWNLPQGAFKECTPDGDIVPLSLEDLKSSQVCFRMREEGDHDVSVTFSLAAVMCTLEPVTVFVKKPKFEIRWANGEEITGENSGKILPGHNVSLNLWCENPAAKITDIFWRPSGKAFKQFIANQNLGVLLELGQQLDVTNRPITTPQMVAQDLEQRTLRKLHWADDGGKDVSVEFKLEGITETTSESFTVQKPTVEFPAGSNPPELNDVSLIPPNFPHTLRFGATGTRGIVFKANVRVPETFANGNWFFGQLVRPGRTVRRDFNGQCRAKSSVSFVLDSNWPYDNAGPRATANEHETSDSPSLRLQGTTLNYHWIDESFQMYIMFKPSQGDVPGTAISSSQYVPLYRVNWSWKCCVQKNPNTGRWAFASPEPRQSVGASWLPVSTHPHWERNVTSVPRVNVNCPNECS